MWFQLCQSLISRLVFNAEGSFDLCFREIHHFFSTLVKNRTYRVELCLYLGIPNKLPGLAETQNAMFMHTEVYVDKHEKVTIDGRVKFHLEDKIIILVLLILNGMQQQFMVSLCFY